MVASGSQEGRQPWVLVVEDEAILLETLECNLQQQGYLVFAAADGRAGLELARSERLDVIILDIMLPGLGGLEGLPNRAQRGLYADLDAYRSGGRERQGGRP